ncbi:hypothetical protein AAVH_20699 [Aphelenchoides avenae]|nr:hypothetical protein AAVH_20699 [Aphelenchus avenae]
MPFLRFLEQCKEKLNNAFFFVMADHGFGLGGIRKTKQGEIEDKNPASFLAMTEQLRKIGS